MCFGKAFHLILVHFYFLYKILWGVFSKIRLFFWKDVFPDFRLIQSIFWSIEILFKIFSEPSPGSIDRTYFSINRTSWIKFFKNSVLTCSNIFSKLFYTFFSHSPTRQGSTKIFLLFSSKILTKFLSPYAGMSILPFLLHCFSLFHA